MRFDLPPEPGLHEIHVLARFLPFDDEARTVSVCTRVSFHLPRHPSPLITVIFFPVAEAFPAFAFDAQSPILLFPHITFALHKPSLSTLSPHTFIPERLFRRLPHLSRVDFFFPQFRTSCHARYVLLFCPVVRPFTSLSFLYHSCQILFAQSIAFVRRARPDIFFSIFNTRA